MQRYSIKMRASREEDGRKTHISGAEKIVEEELKDYCSCLLERALKHSKGKPDFINLKIEAIREEEILFLPALPVTNIETKNETEGRNVVAYYLEKLRVERIGEILSIWEQSYSMRGAILLDCDTLERLEPDKERGVRATYMDMETEDRQRSQACSGKNHFNEALVLATKVLNHPNIVAELCISDDPDYVTGYIASREIGYVRITKLKPMGSANGGRVFLFRGSEEDKEDCIRYLQEQKVLVRMEENGSGEREGLKYDRKAEKTEAETNE